MPTHPVPEFTFVAAVAAVAIALLYILFSSLLKEPTRQQVNAIIIGGAGATYLNGGFGLWELVFCAILVFVAYKGLQSYRFIGIGWVLHTGWDLMHHFYGQPILAFDPLSSAGCALCDTILAIWFFYHAPSLFTWYRTKKPLQQFTP